jgi:hypothetical protein
MGSQEASGYNWRALVEADVPRWKRVNDPGLRSQTDERQQIERAIAAAALNRMLNLGRPNYVRIAWSGTQAGSIASSPPTRATRCLDLLQFSGEALDQLAAIFSNWIGLVKSSAEWRRTGL